MKWQVFVLFLVLASFVCANDFRVDSVFLKTAIKTNGSFDSQLNVENFGESREFRVEVKGVQDFVDISSGVFELGNKEIKSLDLKFSNKNDAEEGVYVGSVDVLSGEEVKRIPVILEIETKDVLFDSNLEVFPNDDVFQGDNINVEMKIFDLGRVGTTNIEMNYFVKDLEGRTVFSETETVNIKDQVSVSKSVSIPEDIKHGDYVLGVSLKYKNSVGTSSVLFRVDEVEIIKEPRFEIDSIALVYLVIALMVFSLIFYLIYSRDKLLYELRDEYKKELNIQNRKIDDEEKVVRVKLKTSKEKSVSKKLFEHVRKKRVKALKKIH